MVPHKKQGMCFPLRGGPGSLPGPLRCAPFAQQRNALQVSCPLIARWQWHDRESWRPSGCRWAPLRGRWQPVL